MRFVVKMNDEDTFSLRENCQEFVNELLIPDDLTIDERSEFALQEFLYALKKSASHLFVSTIEDQGHRPGSRKKGR